MSRKQIALSILCIAILLGATLPAIAAAVRGRPFGPYTFRLVGTSTFQGETFQERDRGRLTLSGLRVKGQTNNGETKFNLKFPARLKNVNRQNSTAKGRVVINDEDHGVNSGPLNANVRVQKTRIGTWKVTANYTGRATKGRARGATIQGRIVAKSS